MLMPGSAVPVGSTDIAELREKLDRTDERLLEELRKRIDTCVEIAHFKRENNVPMMQPHRIGVVQDRAARFADEHGISRDFLRELYEVIIAETCRVEDIVIGAGR